MEGRRCGGSSAGHQPTPMLSFHAAAHPRTLKKARMECMPASKLGCTASAPRTLRRPKGEGMEG